MLMPFAYYGAKHGLAPKYPRPLYDTIVEPFAGSAGYSCHWAAYVARIVLFDMDAEVVKLWRRVLSMTTDKLDEMERHVMHDDRTTDPIMGAMAGGAGLKTCLNGNDTSITPRMRKDWGMVRRRIERTMPHFHKFEVHCGSYIDTPDIEATWHIDPPYQVLRDDYTSTTNASGNAYRCNAIDYTHLADWCRSRRGQVMVCEQSPAAWLPFTAFASQGNAASNSTTRMEVIWRNDQQQERLF